MTLAVDVMFIKNTIYNEHVTKHTCWYCKVSEVHEEQTIMRSLEQVIQEYNKRGFMVGTILRDKQFKQIHQTLKDKGVSLNICAANKHVPEIERYIYELSRREYMKMP